MQQKSFTVPAPYSFPRGSTLQNYSLSQEKWNPPEHQSVKPSIPFVNSERENFLWSFLIILLFCFQEKDSC